MLLRSDTAAGASRNLSPADGQAALVRRGWLASTSPEFQEALLSLCRWKWFEPGETLVAAGVESSPLVGIAWGTASTITALGAPDTPLTHICHPGWWLGTVPILSGGLTENTTAARSPVYCAVVTQRSVKGLLEEHPHLWQDMGLVGLFYARAAANVAADLLLRESHRRCAATLLRTADCRFEGGEPAVAPVNQTDLAAIANLSRNTTNALLREFETRRLIKRNYNYIEIISPYLLREIADGEVDL